MTAVFGRWCRQVAGVNPGGGVRPLPMVFQCTWREKDGAPNGFFLGASIAGQVWKKKLTGSWGIVLELARYDLMRPVVERASYSFDTAPTRQAQKHGERGTSFGNCGETYPFVNISKYVLSCMFVLMPCPQLIRVRPYREAQGPCHGLALRRTYVEANGYEDNNSGTVWQSLVDSCDNCKELLRLYGPITISSFSGSPCCCGQRGAGESTCDSLDEDCK